MNRDWRNDAACKDAPLAVFFPDGKADPIEHLEYARNRYCRECPVLQDCARNAIDSHETHGIWAGIWISQSSGKVARKPLSLVAAGASPPSQDVRGRGRPQHPVMTNGETAIGSGVSAKRPPRCWSTVTGGLTPTKEGLR